MCFPGYVCKQCRLPALMFHISLDEKQNIKLLWPYVLKQSVKGGEDIEKV